MVRSLHHQKCNNLKCTLNTATSHTIYQNGKGCLLKSWTKTKLVSSSFDLQNKCISGEISVYKNVKIFGIFMLNGFRI